MASDQLFRVARIGALAIEVLEDEARAVGWLKRPQIGLGGRTPLERRAAATEGRGSPAQPDVPHYKTEVVRRNGLVGLN